MKIENNYMYLSEDEQDSLNEVLDFNYNGFKPINGQAINTIRELCDAIDLTLEYSGAEIADKKVYSFTKEEAAVRIASLSADIKKLETKVQNLKAQIAQESDHNVLRVLYRELENVQGMIHRLKDRSRFYEDMLQTGNFKRVAEIPVLGEYIRKTPFENPRIILYLKNIRNSYIFNAFVTTFVHEVMHAFFDNKHSEYNVYIKEIEEALVEFAAIRFWACKEGKANPYYLRVVSDKKRRGTEHYGFGAYLYESQKAFADQLCEDFYTNKYSLSKTAAEVIRYVKSFEKEYPWEREKRVAKLLGEAIKSKASIGSLHSAGRNVAIQIPAGTTIIKSGEYNDPEATSVAIPSSVKKIESGAFSGCDSLRNVKVSADTEIEAGAFGVSPETIIIADLVPDNDTFTYPELFYLYPATTCAKTRVCIATEKIRTRAFACISEILKTTPNDKTAALNYFGMAYSTEIVLLDSIKDIAESDFSDMGWAQSIVYDDSVATKLQNLDRSMLESYSGVVEALQSSTTPTLPKTITVVEDKDIPKGLLIIGRDTDEIEENAMCECNNLTGVIMSDSVNSIGEDAFNRCANMHTAIIGESVTDIPPFCFGACINLKDIQLPDGLEVIHHGAFWKCESLESIQIPDTVTRMSSSLFDACISLKEIDLPPSITNIDARTFFGCTSLETVTIPDGVKSIGGHAFEGCVNLTSVNIPKALEVVYIYAFADCAKLSLRVPQYVKLNTDPFKGCLSVTFY
ncbi:MAG: leucine-rich repeat protein [Bacteroidales bacterium]|nr:leucine-rich repeat protein [Bacteroidales bacterium]